jgi:hypothetical protein
MLNKTDRKGRSDETLDFVGLVRAAACRPGSIAAHGAARVRRRSACHWTGKKYVCISVGTVIQGAHAARSGHDPGTPDMSDSGHRWKRGRSSACHEADGRRLGPGDSDGRGSAIVLESRLQKACFYLTARNVTLPRLPLISIGASTTQRRCDTCCAECERRLLGCVLSLTSSRYSGIRNYYVNVHTTDFPNGAIRGQL